jgi:hypothetical protein
MLEECEKSDQGEEGGGEGFEEVVKGCATIAYVAGADTVSGCFGCVTLSQYSNHIDTFYNSNFIHGNGK